MKTAKLTSLFTLPAGLTLLTCLLLSACDQQPANDSAITETKPKAEAPPQLEPEQLTAANKRLFIQGEEAITASMEASVALATAINSFLSTPEQQNLEEAQTQLIDMALEYRHFFFARQIALVDPSTFAELNKADFRIGTFPIQPGFIDAFGDYKYSGIVFDAGFPINRESLSNQHGLTDVSEVVLGIYAIEFLLFNVDGQRQAEDFHPMLTLSKSDRDNGYRKAAELPNNRRRDILRLQAEILVDDLANLKMLWTSEEFTRGHWLGFTPRQQTTKAKRTLSNSLTQLMVEVGDLNTEATPERELPERELKVPPAIFNASLDIKRQYLLNALNSCQTGTMFLGDKDELQDKKQNIKNLMNQAVASLSQKTVKDEEEFWKTTFSQLKDITEAVLTF